MSTIVVTDKRLWVAQYNLSTDLNEIHLKTGQDMKEDTTFGASIHTAKPGLLKTSMSGKGFAQSGTTAVEDVLMGKLGVTAVPITVSRDEGGDAGELCNFFKGVFESYNPDITVGELHRFDFSAKPSGAGDNPLVRGTIFEDGKTSRTSAGNSGVITLGAVGATKKVYAAMHVLAFVGTDVTFKLRSAATSFATITDRIPFTQVTGLTSEMPAPVSGAITDTFWRFDWTTSGGFTSFSVVLAAGIQ